MTSITLLEDEKWFQKNTTDPLKIIILGKPSKQVYDAGHYHGEEDEEDEWIQTLYYQDGGYIFVDDWGGDTKPMTYKEAIDFIKKQFSSINQVKVENSEEKEKERERIENAMENACIQYTLQILNNKIKLEENFDKCMNCNHYIYTGETRKSDELFCDKKCQKQYKKQNK